MIKEFFIMTEEKKTKTGILLMAFGAMSDMSNAYDYLKCVLKERPEALNDELVEDLKDRYSQIGGKSPLLDITKKQAALLEEELKTQGKDVKVYVEIGRAHV